MLDKKKCLDLRNLRCAIRFWMRRLSSGSVTSAQSSFLVDLDLDECFSELECFLDGIVVVFFFLIGGSPASCVCVFWPEPEDEFELESDLRARRFLFLARGENDGDSGAGVIKMVGSRAGFSVELLPVSRSPVRGLDNISVYFVSRFGSPVTGSLRWLDDGARYPGDGDIQRVIYTRGRGPRARRLKSLLEGS